METLDHRLVATEIMPRDTLVNLHRDCCLHANEIDREFYSLHAIQYLHYGMIYQTARGPRYFPRLSLFGSVKTLLGPENREQRFVTLL